MQKMKKFYSLEEVLSTSQNALSVNDIKHYCRTGQLHPCIYFEGNLVCLSEKRYQDDPCKIDPIAHVEEVKWSIIFKGYIHFSKLIDYLDSKRNPYSAIFYNVDKIVEFITQLNTSDCRFPLARNEYLKAFPRMPDDDIKNIRWLREASVFKGNSFHSTEIVFHHTEIDSLFSPKINADTTNTEFPIFYKNEFFNLIEAACLLSKDNPVEVNNAGDFSELSFKFPKFVEAHNLMRSIYEVSNLKELDSPLFLAHDLKQLLANKGYIITGFNDDIEQVNTEAELYELRKENLKLINENNKYSQAIEELINERKWLESRIKEECLPFTSDHSDFPIELSLANFIWKEIYVEKKFPDRFSHERAINEFFRTMNFNDIPLTDKLRERLKTISTPLRLKPKEWDIFKKNLENNGNALLKSTGESP